MRDAQTILATLAQRHRVALEELREGLAALSRVNEYSYKGAAMSDIEQVRAALEEIGKLLDLIDCSDRHNLALLPLFLAQQKRAAAALTRMEQP